jgi:hypothetical protein
VGLEYANCLARTESKGDIRAGLNLSVCGGPELTTIKNGRPYPVGDGLRRPVDYDIKA